MSHFLDFFVLSAVVVVAPTPEALRREVGRTRRLATEPGRGRWSHRISGRRRSSGEPSPPPPTHRGEPLAKFCSHPSTTHIVNQGGGGPLAKSLSHPGSLGEGGWKNAATGHRTPPTHTNTLGRYPRKKFAGTLGRIPPQEYPLLKVWVGRNLSGHYFLRPGVRSRRGLSILSSYFCLFCCRHRHIHSCWEALFIFIIFPYYYYLYTKHEICSYFMLL